MNRRHISTGLGFAALAVWATSAAFVRRLAEGHPFAWAALAYGLGGAALLLAGRRGRLSADARGAGSDASSPPRADRLRRRWGCGGAFTAYSVLYAYAMARAESRRMALALMLINYLWPALTLLMAPFLLGFQARWRILLPGFALCLSGAALGLAGASADWRALASALARDPAPALAMLAAALSWAFYSNGVRKWGGGANDLGWFQIAAGLGTAALWALEGGWPAVSAADIFPFLFYSLAVMALAYRCWDAGMAGGDMVLLATASNFLPLGAAAFGGWYLDQPIDPVLWLAAGIVTLGAILCRRGLRGEPGATGKAASPTL